MFVSLRRADTGGDPPRLFIDGALAVDRDGYGRLMTWVPIVDLMSESVIDDLDAACRQVGFLTIANHGVPTDVIDAAWRASTAFFDLPIKDRMSVAMPYPGYPYGYSPLAGESLAASLGSIGAPDLKESFAIGPVDAAQHEFSDADEEFAWSANIWPQILPEFRPAWERYFREMTSLSERLLSMIARSLDMPSDHFSPLIDRHTSAMRALRYPPRSDSTTTDRRLGAGAHTDYGTLTVLLPDPVEGGLQVTSADGSWHDVDSVPGTLIVNLGDAMARWTNDRWRSTLHRVVVPERQRQSIAFFHNANWDARIECLPTCLGPHETPTYPPIAAGPHLMQKFRSTVNGY